MEAVCSWYFSGFHDMASPRQNPAVKNISAALRIWSYTTVLIPACVGATYLTSSLINRVKNADGFAKYQEILKHKYEEHLAHLQAENRAAEASGEVLIIMELKHADREVIKAIKREVVRNNIPTLSELRRKWAEQIDREITCSRADKSTLKEILKGLLIGSYQDLEAIYQMPHVRTIISIDTETAIQIELKEELLYHRCFLQDPSSLEEITGYILAVKQVIHAARTRGEGAAVVCETGDYYSAFYIIAYLMELGLNLNEAYRFVKNKQLHVDIGRFDHLLSVMGCGFHRLTE